MQPQQGADVPTVPTKAELRMEHRSTTSRLLLGTLSQVPPAGGRASSRFGVGALWLYTGSGACLPCVLEHPDPALRGALVWVQNFNLVRTAIAPVDAMATPPKQSNHDDDAEAAQGLLYLEILGEVIVLQPSPKPSNGARSTQTKSQPNFSRAWFLSRGCRQAPVVTVTVAAVGAARLRRWGCTSWRSPSGAKDGGGAKPWWWRAISPPSAPYRPCLDAQALDCDCTYASISAQCCMDVKLDQLGCKIPSFWCACVSVGTVPARRRQRRQPQAIRFLPAAVAAALVLPAASV